MAEGAEVFTNGTDLLRQAFQHVVDDEEQENDIVAFLQGDSQVIQLTAEQAAALGLTFKVDSPEHRETQEVENAHREIIGDNTPGNHQVEGTSLPMDLDFQQNGSVEATFDEWPSQAAEDFRHDSIVPELSMESIDVSDNLKEPAKLDETSLYSIESTSVQTTQNSIAESQTQILQKLPVLLPSSQFIIKPAQTVFTPVKNIRILPNTIQAVGTSQNSMLLPKTTLASPQIIKTIPFGAQLFGTGNVPLINTSQVLTGGCDLSGQVISEIPTSVPITNHIRASPTVKNIAQLKAKGNLQHFLTPVLKTNKPLMKSTQILTNGTKHRIGGSVVKPMQVANQVLKTNFVQAKSTVPSKSTNSSLIFKTTSLLKSQHDQKSKPVMMPRMTQTNTNSVSILKPQTGIVTNNRTFKPSVPSVTRPIIKQINGDDSKKTIITTRVLKQSPTIRGTSIIKNNKKFKPAMPNSISVVTDQSENNKPLGSSENPIQIVQQGHTFHSMQQLSQAQLQQIAHVLQQRSQEARASNEKVVYRLVFPEDLDLRLKNPATLLKSRGGKRGRPKKNSVRPPVLSAKPVVEEEHDDVKDDRKKVVARTRSGRLSRPPRHMVRDYKHLHHLDFTTPDLDDSDGGYSDYNTNGDKLGDDECPKELLTGLEMPKRKISDHFRCPTCNKIYLGRTRMLKHFETHPDHGSPSQLPPPNVDPDLKQLQDPLKRKGKKRGPWAYVTPEAKSERRQLKLREAISVCENDEIVKIAAKPVLKAQSLFDLLVLKSENDGMKFFNELKELVCQIRQKSAEMLTAVSENERNAEDCIDLSEDLLCDTLGMNPGLYRINNVFDVEESSNNADVNEPPMKMIKMEDVCEEGTENLEERLSSGFSESSDVSVSDFLNERRNDDVNCPEVLSALTLVPRNPEPPKDTSVTDLQCLDGPGFQKLDMSASPTFAKFELMKEPSFTKMGDSLDASCNDVFTKLESLQRTFIKLEPNEDGFVKLENGMLGSFSQADDGFHYMSPGTESFTKSFRKLVPRDANKYENSLDSSKLSDRRISDMLQDTVQITTSNCDPSLFGSKDNLDMSSYDHMAHLDILNSSGVMDEKLVEQLQLVDQSNIVDDIVNERLKNILPEAIVESCLLSHSSQLDEEDLDFAAISEEFNRNTGGSLDRS